MTRQGDQATSSRQLSAVRPAPRRGLSRIEAAIYVGVGTTKFDAMVDDGRMPQPKRIDGRLVWDILALDRAFDALPDEHGEASEDWTAVL